MKRLVLLIAGGVLGGTTMLIAERSGLIGDVVDRPSPVDVTNRATAQRAGAGPGTRFAAYRAAARIADGDTLASLLANAAASAPSLRRDIELDALLMRLAELDPEGAVRIALELTLDEAFVAEAYRAWARQDLQAALRGLALPVDRQIRLAAAVVLFEMVDDDRSGFERVAAELPDDQAERAMLEVEWLAWLADRNPYAALREALLLPDVHVQSRAMPRIAASWVQADPHDALTQAQHLPDDLRIAYLASVASQWSLLDPVAYLDHLRTGGATGEMLFGIPFAVAADPDAALAMAEGISGPVAMQLRSAVFQVLAERGDPLAVVARIDAMGPSPARNDLLQVVAQTYARRDPDAALAWAATRATAVRMAVIAQVAESDPDRLPGLIDTMLRSDTNSQASLVPLLTRMGRDPAHAPLVADQLLARNDRQSVSALRTVVTGWVQQDPGRAMDWVAGNATDLQPALVDQLARSFAETDVAAAATYLDVIPMELRPSWLAGVAGAYARHDPEGAFSWLDRLRGQEGYDQALQQVIAESARTNPVGAAAIAGRTGASLQPATASTIAGNWTREDPEAAARWALGVDDAGARQSAVGAVAMNWARRDLAAAVDWAVALPDDGLRERALSTLLFNSATSGNEVLAQAFVRIADWSPDEARMLLDRHVNDARVRRQIEAEISGSESGVQPGTAP